MISAFLPVLCQPIVGGLTWVPRPAVDIETQDVVGGEGVAPVVAASWKSFWAEQTGAAVYPGLNLAT